MKKFLISVLAVTLLAASIGTFAQDHSSHGSSGPTGPSDNMDRSGMQAMKQDMQRKMSAAKTAEERQAVMKEHQQSMQKHMGSMHQQMPMGQMTH